MNNLSTSKKQSATLQRKPQTGVVYLVGAGPGDPDLLTLRAAKLLEQADVVVYDNLVSEGIVNFIHRDAQKIFVGKEKK